MVGRHIDKPKWNPQVTWGTIFTLIGGVVFAIGLVVVLNVRDAEAALKIEAVEKKFQAIEQRMTRMEERLDKRLVHMDGKLDRLIERGRDH